MENVVTVKDYLLGCAGNYPIEESTLQYISINKNVALDKDISELSKRDRDMLEVEMLRYLLRAPGMTSSVSDKNGTWEHKEGAVEMNSTEKKYLAKRLKELEDEYGLTRSSIKVHALGMRVWGQAK